MSSGVCVWATNVLTGSSWVIRSQHGLSWGKMHHLYYDQRRTCSQPDQHLITPHFIKKTLTGPSLQFQDQCSSFLCFSPSHTFSPPSRLVSDGEENNNRLSEDYPVCPLFTIAVTPQTKGLSRNTHNTKGQILPLHKALGGYEKY